MAKGADVLLEVDGIAYGVWMAARATGDGYTVTHPDSGNNGITMQNPMGIIEDLARTYLGLGTSDYDRDSFNVAALLLSNWKFDFVIDEVKSARDVINEIALLCQCRVYYDYLGILKVKVLDESGGFAVSGNDTASGLDIFTTTPTVTSGAFTEHPILGKKDSLSLKLTPYSELATNVEMRYRFRHDRDAFILIRIDSASDYGGKTYNVRFQTTYVKHKNTATNIVDFILDTRKVQHWLAEFQTSINAIDKEITDFINIRHPTLDGILGTSTMNAQKWEILNISLNPDKLTIKIKAWALPSIGTPPNA